MKFVSVRWHTVLPTLLGGALVAACAAQPASPSPSPAAARALEAFPSSLAGHQRYVIELPELADEAAHKLELIGGKAMAVDCNARGMDGHFESHDVPGWGYTWWSLQSKGQVLSTMMLCPPGTAKPGFVQAPPLLVRYNSKLPVVVFVPEGMQLRWRVWTAGAVREAQPR